MTVSRLIRLLLLVLLIAFIAMPERFAPLFQPLTEDGAPAIYTQASLFSLTLSHLALVAGATLASTVIAAGLAILVTRPFGAEFLPFSRAFVNIGQTIPPVAVLALTVPIFGFGSVPTTIALFLYGLLPIFENALAGLTGLPAQITDAAKGVGMTGFQRLVSVELPLALPLILTGIRISTVISLATATIGSTVAASTLGEVIIAGLLANNTAFVLQGGLVVAVLALLLNDGLAAVERIVTRRLVAA